LAILGAVATAHTTSLFDGGESLAHASTAGFQWGLLGGAGFVLAAAFVALLGPNTRDTVAVEAPEVLETAEAVADAA
jgi:hypothetical protein